MLTIDLFGYSIHQSKAFGTGDFNVQYTKRAYVRFQSSHEPRMVVNKSKIQIYINWDAMSSTCRCLTISKDFEVPVCARGQAHP